MSCDLINTKKGLTAWDKYGHLCYSIDSTFERVSIHNGNLLHSTNRNAAELCVARSMMAFMNRTGFRTRIRGIANMKQKHAVCIMAHKNVEQLNILIEILDHECIDIYLHIDAKSNIVLNKVITPKLATLTEVARHDTRWGDVSQMYTEMELFRAVNKSNIDYCRVHLISGEDLPVWKIDDIIAFFDKECNRDVEYIIANEYVPAEKRLRYYWLCTRHMRGALVYKIIRHTTLLLQRLSRVNRLKYCDLPFRMGPNWVSLTPKAINHIVNVFPRYERNFCYSVCVDEVYKQMLLGGRFISPKMAICTMPNFCLTHLHL